MMYKRGYTCERCKKDLVLDIYNQAQTEKDQDQIMRFVDFKINLKTGIRDKNGNWSTEASFGKDRFILCQSCFDDMFGKILEETAE